MDHIDIVLLDCLSEYWSPARFFSRKDADQIFNRSVSLPNGSELVERVEKLIASGCVVAKSTSRGLFIPQGDELREAVQSPSAPTNLKDEMFLGLTTLGGSKWESELNPNWNAFVLCEVVRGRKLRIQAASQEVLEALLKKVTGGLRGKRMRTLHPWQPLYWKFLPEGFAVTGRAQRVSPPLQRALKEQRLAWLRSLGLIK